MEAWPSIRAVLRTYTRYEGRTGRREYWVWWIAALFMLALFSVPYSVWRGFYPDSAAVPDGFMLASISLGTIAFLLTVPASIALGVRRLHDANLSGWYLFGALVFVVGGAWPLVMGFFTGTPAANRFGEPPPSSPTDLSPLGGHRQSLTGQLSPPRRTVRRC